MSEKLTKKQRIQQIKHVLDSCEPKPLGIYHLNMQFENEVRVEYDELPYINRDITKRLDSIEVRINGLNTRVIGGSSSGKARAYLFLEILGL